MGPVKALGEGAVPDATGNVSAMGLRVLWAGNHQPASALHTCIVDCEGAGS